ncbi:MAG: Ig-like domain-containing protein [Firmicutes bacterium]|nr:Ig-like domain-containing protein [Bacillota bacterium]
MKKLLGLALVTALCAVLLCTGAMADEVGDFTVTGDTEDENYSYAGGVLTIKTGTPLTIKNTDSSKSTTDRIVIGSGVTANLTFAGVNISLGVNENTNGVSAVTVPSGATLHLTLADGSVNTLVGDTNGGSSNSGAGIEAPKGATLTISCAHSGDNGHVCSENCGSLSASGAAWGVANGCAAGIGGKQAAGGTITINGGNIEATGGRGAGIGGGGMDRPCTGGTIVINGGIVEAQGGLESAGIGGSAASSGNITINGGTVTARSFVLVSSVGGAGIGAGEGTHDPSGEITITGGTVTAYGTDGGAGIGGGCFNAVSKISISGGTVMAYGAGGAGIGSGSGSIYGYGGDITITGGAVTAYGAWGGAGIGGGRSGNGGDITISGGTVIACGGEYTGNYESEEYYGPSGIGSGGFYVDTEDDETYNTEKPKPGTFSTGESGSAIIFAYGGRGKDGAGEAFSAGDTSGWSGLIFQGVAESYEDGLPKELSASGEVYGATFTLTGDLSIPAEHGLTVGADKSLSIGADAVLSIEIGGSLNNAGTIGGSGELQVRYNTDPMAAAKTLEPGGTLDLSACLSSGVFEGNDPEDGVTFTRPEWSSSAPAVATVDENGRVTALANGKTEISVGGVKVCSISVRTSATGVELDRDTLRLTVGGTEQLTATVSPESASEKGVEWSSSAPDVASVDADGLVTAHKPGTAVITVTTGDGNFTASCTVSVRIPVTGVELDRDTLKLTVGGTEQLTATVSPESATDKSLTWSSSDPDVASVNADGLVTAHMPGEAVITVTSAEGPSAECLVRVLYPINVPDTYDITVMQPANGDVSVNLPNASAGAAITVTAVPDEGYELAYITVDGERISGTSFTMPGHAVTVSAVFVRAGLPFTDVAYGDWFYDEVAYVYANGLMEGVSDTAFEPGGGMTRAMVWAILARIDGVTVTGSNWAETARSWAMAKGISDGENASAPVTREQLVTMLYRYAGEPVVSGSLTGWADAASVSGWAGSAMTWAVNRGIITGATESTLAPADGATRAQCAAILMRYIEA